MPKLRTFRWFVLGVAAVAVVVVFVLARGRSWWPGRTAAAGEQTAQTADSAPPSVPVKVAHAESWTLPQVVEAVGTFRGEEEVEVAAKVPGRVVKVLRDMGDVVRPGEALLEIDPTDFRLAVDEARGNVQAELAKIGLASMPDGDFDAGKVYTVVRAENLKQIAANRLKRAAELREKATITPDEFDQLETEYKVAQANYQQAVVDAKATLATARQKKAVLATAEQRLKDATLVAPTPTRPPPGGVPTQFAVAARDVDEGEMVSVGGPAPLFRLVLDTALRLVVTVPERHIGEIRPGQRVEIGVEAYCGRTFEGKVSRVSPAVDRTSRAFDVEIEVANAQRELKPGGFAKAAVLVGEDADARLVPSTAVVSFAGVDKVFAVEGGKARAVKVDLGVAGRGWRQVRGELGQGDLVVTLGHSQLADGSPVRVLETEGPLEAGGEDLPWNGIFKGNEKAPGVR